MVAHPRVPTEVITAGRRLAIMLPMATFPRRRMAIPPTIRILGTVLLPPLFPVAERHRTEKVAVAVAAAAVVEILGVTSLVVLVMVVVVLVPIRPSASPSAVVQREATRQLRWCTIKAHMEVMAIRTTAVVVVAIIPAEDHLGGLWCIPVLPLPCWMGAKHRFPKEVEMVLAVVVVVAVHRLHLPEVVVLLHRLVLAKVEAKSPRRIIGTKPVAVIAVARWVL